MNMWSKLIMAIRGGVNDMGDAIMDTQALQILDQEIRDADGELKKSCETLANIMIRQKTAEEAIKKYDVKIAEYDNYGIKAIKTGDEALAMEVAEKIAQIEEQRDMTQQQADEYAEGVKTLRKTIAQAESNIKRLKQQVDIVKATESLQKAQITVARRYGGGKAKLPTALDSMELIKKRQTAAAVCVNAGKEPDRELNDDPLKEKLKKAGIISSNSGAESVMLRLKMKAANINAGQPD